MLTNIYSHPSVLMGEIEFPIHVELDHMIYWKVGVRGFKLAAQALGVLL